MANESKQKIDVGCVQRLVSQQFPEWATLPILPVETSGWDNRTFHLGDDLLLRLPSRAEYASQVEKEQVWLPRLQPHLPLMIPKPLAMGKPNDEYPWPWSVYQWIDGETVTTTNITNQIHFAEQLANFLKALHQCDTQGAPKAGPDNFHRGGNLAVYDAETKRAIAKFEDKQMAKTFDDIWTRALASTWERAPVWIHGDIATGNLLVKNGELHAVIDFGQLAIGDPACDLAIAWTFLKGESRQQFRDTLSLDDKSWDRARGWALWKTLCAAVEGTDRGGVLREIVSANK